MITEGMLATAAAEMDEAMLRSLPAPEDCHHDFSLRFKKKMKRVIYRADHPLQFRVLQKVASIILVLFLGFAAIMAVSPTVRATVFGWIREQCGKFINYYFDDYISSSSEPLDYQLSNLPDGYVLIAESDIPGNQAFVYTNTVQQYLYFTYSTDPDTTSYLVKEDGYVVEQITVQNSCGDIYLSEDPSESNCIIWCNEESSTIFYISGFLSHNELIEIANSVQPIK